MEQRKAFQEACTKGSCGYLTEVDIAQRRSMFVNVRGSGEKS